MLKKLEELKTKYDNLIKELSKPEIIQDQNMFADLSREQKNLEPIVKLHKEYKTLLKKIEDDESILKGNDKELKEIVKEELDDLLMQREKLEEKIKIELIPKDPNDDKNTIVEIRGGTGGDEAAIFAADLFRMYSRYVERQNWKIKLLSSSPIGLGGFKEISFMIAGEGAYGQLKYESGVHRVQRVPSTETQGRIHTSAATVAVLPEADKVEVDIQDKDIRIDTYRASGAGGQHVNKTESAIRITHNPTGIVVSCQDESSQHKNKAKALMILYSRVLQAKIDKQKSERDKDRRSQVSTGDRSAKIRTYNFPQGRVTDHRINFTTHQLQSIMDGDLYEIIEQLKIADNVEKLKNL
ncbi:MAG: peptide chain release factor 1 [Candidatus Marinimicrobia bacterium]|nr:peptide chain release factor 1 [Candidatus Neomarinimicrobiota bacterium]